MVCAFFNASTRENRQGWATQYSKRKAGPRLGCHSERSEESLCHCPCYTQNHGEILRFAQNDSKPGWRPQDPQWSALSSDAALPAQARMSPLRGWFSLSGWPTLLGLKGRGFDCFSVLWSTNSFERKNQTLRPFEKPQRSGHPEDQNRIKGWAARQNCSKACHPPQNSKQRLGHPPSLREHSKKMNIYIYHAL